MNPLARDPPPANLFNRTESVRRQLMGATFSKSLGARTGDWAASDSLSRAPVRSPGGLGV
jgi:hypothetical protein